MIEYGDADIMVAGGAEATVCMSGIGGFCSVRHCPSATIRHNCETARLTSIAMGSYWARVPAFDFGSSRYQSAWRASMKNCWAWV